VKQHELLTWTPDMVRRYWDYEAQFTSKFFTSKYNQGIIGKIRRYLPKGARVLDYGCGPGNLIRPLLNAGFQVAGMDTSTTARQKVAAEFGQMPNFLGIFEQGELDESGLRFDVIVVAEVIEHLYDSQLDELLDTLKTLATADTQIIFTTPNEEVLEDSYILCPVSGQLFHRWQHVRNWSKDSVTAFLEARNLAVSTAFTTDFGTSFKVAGRKRPWPAFWKALRKTIVYGLRPGQKQPHLVVIARIRAQ
jgi:2-polyprenyl-3-methyl-5-hydroxy-6-metoxy-1,4-benzoquinol methylase